MFMVPGSANVIRVNGRAWLTADATLRQGFARGEALPRAVVVFDLTEVYSQCARAIQRAGLWAGRTIAPACRPWGKCCRARPGFDGDAYDADRANARIWVGGNLARRPVAARRHGEGPPWRRRPSANRGAGPRGTGPQFHLPSRR